MRTCRPQPGPSDPIKTPAQPGGVPQALPALGDGVDLSIASERRLGDRIARGIYRDPDLVDDAVLGDYFGRRMAAELGWEEWPGFATHVSALMEQHPWPGNVRELRNVVERAIYRWDDWSEPVGQVQFDPFDSPWQPSATAAPAPAGRPAAPAPQLDHSHVTDLRSAVDAHEKAIVEHALGRHRWNQRQTAAALGLSYDQLRHCLKKHGLLERSEQ
jgi:psp operon transcriptional activator